MRTFLSSLSAIALIASSTPAFAKEEGAPLTRAEFTAAVVDSLVPGTANIGCFDRLDPNPTDLLDFTLIFSDVSTKDPYALQICAAFRAGISKGYTDGSFHPNELVNLAEASKMLTIAFALPAAPAKEGDVWFAQYTDAVQAAGVLKGTKNWSSTFTMNDATSMISSLKTATNFVPYVEEEEVTTPVTETPAEEETVETPTEPTEAETGTGAILDDTTNEPTSDETEEDTEDAPEEETGTGAVLPKQA